MVDTGPPPSFGNFHVNLRSAFDHERDKIGRSIRIGHIPKEVAIGRNEPFLSLITIARVSLRQIIWVDSLDIWIRIIGRHVVFRFL